MIVENLEDLYELSPLQQGLLFHSLYAPGSGVYIEQLSLTLSGQINIAAFKLAWEQVIARHSALRTGFYWEGLDRPHQVVYRGIELPWEFTDWRHLSNTEQQVRTDKYLQTDRERSFNFSQPPLMRFALMQTGENTYRLIWTFHHLILDGWSMGIVLKEVTKFYRQANEGHESEVERPPAYREYISWIQKQDLVAAESFWRRTLKDFTEQTRLGIARGSKSAQKYGRQRFSFNEELTAQLPSFTRRHQLTANTLVQAAWGLLLRCYSGEPDVVFGTTSSGRPPEIAGVERIVGLFVNTLPVRLKIDDTRIVLDWLQEVQRQQAEIRQYEYSPLVDIQGWSEVPRGAPLFNSLLGYQNYPVRLDGSLWKLHGSVEVSDIGAFEQVSYPLCALVIPGEQLSVAIYYDSKLIDYAAIARMAAHLEKLLSEIVAHPDQSISQLSLITAEEEKQIHEWNLTGTQYPAASIHELFEVQAARCPDAVAVKYGQDSLTYAELNRRGNQLAHYLRKFGVGPETRVAICLERSVEMIVALIGIIKAGGAYLPLDLNYPRERLGFMLEDAQAAVLITEERILDHFPDLSASVVCLGRDASTIAEQDEKNPDCISRASDLAYVMYTSGSTGIPKGVCIEQRSVVQLVLNTNYIQLGNDDRVAQTSSFSFDAATFEIWAPLLNGARLVGFTKDVILSPGELAAELEKEKISVLFLTTALFNQLARETPQVFSSLRYLLFGGEAVDPHWVREVLDKGRPSHLLHFYGPTETTTFASWFPINSLSADASTVPIGRAVTNTRLYLLDEHLRHVPIGAPGELYIGGDGLARGYFNRPQLTEERFIHDPFSSVPGERLYKTGDLGRYLEDGNIEFLGRVDSQVKLRGFRIEPGEIEAALCEHDAVAKAAVMLREDTPGDKRLVAYVVVDSQATGSCETAESSNESRQVEEWQMFYDDLYQQGSPNAVKTFNTIGWNSTYTGQPIPEEEMRIWLDDTVERILSLKPQRVLEIGCGTGLLLFKIAPHVSRYVGTDFSPVALAGVREQLKASGESLTHVELLQRTATHLADIEPGSFDTVILNSVVQYFPDIDYLVKVLEEAARVVGKGGAIFLGDVRSYPLLEAFHTSIQFLRAHDSLTLTELSGRVQKQIAQENELTIDPKFFTALSRYLPAISHVEVVPKRGAFLNELTQFRYQVVLHVAGSTPASNGFSWIDWQKEDLVIDDVRQMLRSINPDLLAFRNVPNARLSFELFLLEATRKEDGRRTVGELRRQLQESSDKAGSVTPDELWALSSDFGYDVEIGWEHQSGGAGYDVVMRRKDFAKSSNVPVSESTPPVTNNSWTVYANKPLRAKLSRQLAPELRSFLQQRLPDYMVPANFVMMADLPLNPNGKVDRKRLPAPDESRPEMDSNYVAPRSLIEEVLVNIWSQVLGHEKIGVQDNFFDLGGHSLLATQVVSRVSEAFKINLPLRTLFDAPVIDRLATRIEDLRNEQRGIEIPAICRRDFTVAPRLSYAQQRLWWLDQFEPANTVYNTLIPIQFEGQLNICALEQSLNEIVRRHEALRTVFPVVNGEPRQSISSEATIQLSVNDLQSLPLAEQKIEVERFAKAALAYRFDLATGPLVRTEFLKLNENLHILLVSMHHIVTDGWSIGIFLRELAALYETFVMDKPSPLAELNIQYADYAEWQRNYLEGEVLENQLAYWHKQLKGSPTAIYLPVDHPRPPVETFRGRSEPIHLPLALTEALRKLSREEGVTLFMTLLAAFKVLLLRYTGEPDIVVGSPIANRHHAEIENIIGIFINTIVLRTDLSGDPTFVELLGRIREVTLGAYGHQDVPFERLVEELQPVRDLSRHPLFQVMFVLQNTPGLTQEIKGQRLSVIEIETEVSKFDLTVSLLETETGLAGSVEYNTDLFERETIMRFLQHYETLLESIVSDREQQVSQLSFITDGERHRVLKSLNQTDTQWAAEQCVHQLFERQAELAPDAVAISFGDRRLTYGEVNQRANQLARHLREQGIGGEVRVGIMLERSPEMVAALLAVLKAGGAYVPLDPAYPAERLSFMMQDAGVGLVLTDSKLRERLSGDQRYLCLDSEQWPGSEHSGDNLESGTTPESLAYVIYTSGSTGRPKGVEIEHGALLNFLRSMEQQPGLKASDTLLAVTTLSFDIAGLELYLPLLVGARVELASREVASDGEQLAALLKSAQATVMQATPATWRLLLETGWEGDRELKILCGGEALAPDLAAALLKRGGEVWNLYGPTETTIWSSCEQVLEGAGVSIGRPIANTQIYILDEALEPVPVGVRGEIYIGGEGIARGYHGRADLTAARFVPDPFGGGGGRLYRTGDVGRFLASGRIECLGRLDHQLKVRGFRIEPGEIEAALSEHAAVAEAVVVGREDEAGDKRLVCYLVPVEGAAPSVADLRQHLRMLPEYMVPSVFVTLECLPLTLNGKVDRKALPAPALSPSENSQRNVAPQTPVEEILIGLWRDVLKVETVGVEDNFFENGGHSLLATQLASRLRTAFKIELPLRAIFEEPTVKRLTQRIRKTLEHKQFDETTDSISPADRNGHLELSFAQQRLWFLDQLEPNSSRYNIFGAARLQGELDVEALRNSLNAIVRRHETLRTTFPLVDGKPVQLIKDRLDIELPVLDLSENANEEIDAKIQAYVNREAQCPFSLQDGPLLRASLLRVKSDEHVLILSLHHIVSDGWSLNVMRKELVAFYKAYSQGTRTELADLKIQYADYAKSQRDWLQGETLETQLDYWRTQLKAPLPVLDLPTDHPRPAVQTTAGAHRSVVLSRTLSELVRKFSRREGVTLYMTLLAAFQTLLGRYTGQDDIIVGTAVAGRNRTETELLIGYFVNTLVMRTDLSGGPTFREILRRVREVALAAYTHQDLPFERLVDELKLERDLSRSPLFQVMFDLQNAPTEIMQLEGLTLSPVEYELDSAKFDLSWVVLDQPDGLLCHVEYNTDLFEADRIERMLGHFEVLLAAAIDNADIRIADLPILTEAEQDLMLNQWNDTRCDYQHQFRVHQLFEQHAQLNSGAVAVSSDTQMLSYGELNSRANQLARCLTRLRVRPDTLVAVLLDRSIDLVVALLAILKAGAAYVPLDPEYPPDRLAFMLADSNAVALITNQSLLGSVKDTHVQVLCLDRDWPEISHKSSTDLNLEVAPADLVYMIYTSGSTGTPKGVEIEHRGLSNLVEWHRHEYQLTAADRGTLIASPSFDASVWELWPYLASGASVHIPDDDTRMSPNNLLLWLTAQRITVSFLPTPVAQAMLALDLPRQMPLRALLTGGDRLHQTKRSSLPFTLLNHYGPTENTVVATCCEVDPLAQNGFAPPIGKPIANTQVYLLDNHLQPVPVGVAGEIFIGGDSLARGYRDRSALTQEKFIPNRFDKSRSQRLYRTGDLGRYLPDGRIEYLARTDHQVKIRAFRIELGEIEAILGQHPSVKENVVLAREDEPGNRWLVAYVVPTSGQQLSSSELRSYLTAKLPPHMLPSVFVMLEALPQTANGKVDRAVLPVPEQPSSELNGNYVAPRTHVEETLAGIWASVLKLGKVGINDNFFELGGDSIVSIQIVARAHQAGLHFTPKQLFQHQTVADLAPMVVGTVTGEINSEIVTGPVPLTPIQHWFFEQNLAEAHHFNQALLLDVPNTLNAAFLDQALRLLVAHHDALRLRFNRDDNGWRQENAAVEEATLLSQIDLSSFSGDEQRLAFERKASELQRSLNLSQGPLVCAALFDMGKSFRLLLVIHHLAVDGVSWRVLLEDLEIAYEQLSRSETVVLPSKTTSFKSWAERLTEYALSTALQSDSDYWMSPGSENCARLPVDFPDGDNSVSSVRSVTVTLDADETAALLQDVPSVYHTQINDVLLTALSEALKKWTRALSFVVDVEGHGREEVVEGIDLSRTVGWFTTITPVILAAAPVFDPGPALTATKEQLRAVPNRGIGYGVLRYLGPEAAQDKLKTDPQPEISFNYLGQLDPISTHFGFSSADESPGPLYSPLGQRRHLIEVIGSVSKRKLRISFNYSTNLHRAETVQRLATDFIDTLRSLITHCCSSEAEVVTASDFLAARMSQNDFATLIAKIK